MAEDNEDDDPDTNEAGSPVMNSAVPSARWDSCDAFYHLSPAAFIEALLRVTSKLCANSRQILDEVREGKGCTIPVHC